MTDPRPDATLPIDLPEARDPHAATLPAKTAVRQRKAGELSTTSAVALASQDGVADARPTAAVDTLGSVFDLLPDEVPGVVLVDPRIVEADTVNVHHDLVFDPAAYGELIWSMRRHGNTVPVVLRRRPAPAPGFRCTSGLRRLGAALHLQRELPGFRLRAVIREDMSDAEAFVVAEADNAGRSTTAPVRQARHWAATLETVYGGDRQAFIAATGRSPSVVSRTLALLTLPAYVLAACSDPEALTPYFAEQLAPRLGDPAEEPAIRARAEALVAAGRRLPAPALARALLNGGRETVTAGTVWSSPDGKARLASRPARGGLRLELTGSVATAADRRAALRAIDALLRQPAS